MFKQIYTSYYFIQKYGVTWCYHGDKYNFNSDIKMMSSDSALLKANFSGILCYYSIFKKSKWWWRERYNWRDSYRRQTKAALNSIRDDLIVILLQCNARYGRFGPSPQSNMTCVFPGIIPNACCYHIILLQ